MTLTHQLSSSIDIDVFSAPFKSSQKLGQISSSSQVQLLEEKTGINCEFIKIESDIGIGYVETSYVSYEPLEEKYLTAPSICPTTQFNLSFIEPEWFNLTEDEPYINEKTLEYSVCITANSYSIKLLNDSSILESGIKALFKFYNKPYDQTTLNTYKNYYLFASIKDYHLPYRPFQRSKYLVTIPVKYFDAIENAQTVDRDTSNANYIVKISLKDKDKYFKNLKRTLILYRDNIFFANTTIKFRNPLIEGQNLATTENAIALELDMQQKIDSVENFELQLDNLLTLNGIPTILKDNDTSEITLQFALNNQCNKIYDVSVDNNGNCKKLNVGLDAFLNKESVSDPTTVNFIKNIENIYFIEVCKVPWYEFVETYVYPEVEVLQPTQEPAETNYEVFLRAYKAYLAFTKANDTRPLKTYEEIADEYNTMLIYRATLYSDKFINFFYNQQIYQSDNFFNPDNLQKTLLTFKRLAIDAGIEPPAPNRFGVKLKVNSTDKEDTLVLVTPPIGGNTVQEGWTTTFSLPTEFETPETRIYEINPRVYVTKPDGTISQHQLYLFIDKPKQKTFEEIINQIYKVINKVGICKITDFANECLLFLTRSLNIDVDATITYGVMKNYTYKELMFEILPYLPSDQQQFIYEQLLLDLSCVNKESLLYILKTNLTQEEYTTLNLDNASYQDIIKEVSKQMVGTINE